MPHSTKPYGFETSILDHASSMLAFWDRDLRCRYANRAYEVWFGVTPESLIGKSIQTLLGPDLFAMNEPYIRKALEGVPQTFERLVPGPDGVSRSSLARYTPDVIGGRVVGFIAEVTDVTPLKQAYAALEASVVACNRANDLLKKREADLELAQSLGQIGSWHLEVAADISTWSTQLYRIFGLDAKQLPPGYAEGAKLHPPKSWARLQEAVQRAISEGTPYCLEVEFYRQDGTVGYMEARGFAERDELGFIIGLHGTAQDITERHQLAQRTFEMAASEFAELDRKKDNFLSMLGHELRNNLAPIPTGLEVMRRSTSQEAVARVHSMVLRQVKRMARLIEDLYELRRLQSGEFTLKRKIVSVSSVVTSAVEMSLEAIHKQGNRLVLELRDEIHIDGDEVRLAQVISNLLNNAAKFTLNGLIKICVTKSDDNFVEIAIIDTGIGMAADQQEAVFELYAQSPDSGEQRQAGLGIGLHIVKRLVETHGGHVWASSSGVGLGSTFTMRFPLAPSS